MSSDFEQAGGPLSEQAQHKISKRFERASYSVAESLREKGQMGYYRHAKKKLDRRIRNEICATASFFEEPNPEREGPTHIPLGLDYGFTVGGLFAYALLNTQQVPRFVRDITQNMRAIRAVPTHEAVYDAERLVEQGGRSYAGLFMAYVGRDALLLASIKDREETTPLEDRMQSVYENSFGYMCADAMTRMTADAILAESGLKRREKTHMENQADIIARLDEIKTEHIDWLQ